MAGDYDRDRIQTDGVSHGANSSAVLTQLCKVAVAYEPGLVFQMCQIVKLSPDPFLEVGAEQKKIVPGSLLPELPYLVEICSLSRNLLIRETVFLIGLLPRLCR